MLRKNVIMESIVPTWSNSEFSTVIAISMHSLLVGFVLFSPTEVPTVCLLIRACTGDFFQPRNIWLGVRCWIVSLTE